MKIAILGNCLYALNHTDNGSLFFIGGIGFYDRDDVGPGLNAGLLYRLKIGENLYAYGLPRFHLLLSEPSGQFLQLAVGIKFSLGNSQ